MQCQVELAQEKVLTNQLSSQLTDAMTMLAEEKKVTIPIILKSSGILIFRTYELLYFRTSKFQNSKFLIF